uniref:Secreted protein n=1 Tax=Achlya hypogyna TaxID=1202772 RepID=A0A0A7CP69_ACHHY|nr:secreted protein [Achlya hypogyna]
MPPRAHVYVVCVVVCVVVFLATQLATLDGRLAPSPPVQRFVVPGRSVWRKVKASQCMDSWFVCFLRCSRHVFNEIVARIEAHWVDAHGVLHHHAQHDVADRVAVCLFYFTHVDGYDCAVQVFGICRTLAKTFTSQVTTILANFCFAPTVELPTTASAWHANMNAFEAVAGFPNVCCAVDGTLIRIKMFADHEGWYCRKGVPSFDVQGVVDARKRFLAVSIKAGFWFVEIQVPYLQKGAGAPDPKTMARIIQATMVLHNWMIDLDESEDAVDVRPWMHVDGDNLGLGGNALTSLPAEIGRLTCLETLHAERNQLTCLPEALATVTLDHNLFAAFLLPLTKCARLTHLSHAHTELLYLQLRQAVLVPDPAAPEGYSKQLQLLEGLVPPADLNYTVSVLH